MLNNRKFTVSHAPFWHNGSSIFEKSYHMMLAALPAALWGIYQYGIPAAGVLSLSISAAILWELGFNKISKRPISIADGNAALIGMLFGMLMPATTPWWVILTGTAIAIIIGKQIYGGIGGNPFNPVVIAVAIMLLSWPKYFDFDTMLVHYDLGFAAAWPLAAAKYFGPSAVEFFKTSDLLMGKQIGGIGSTFGFGLLAGGVYLILRGFTRWEIVVSFLAGVFITALLFNLSDPSRFASPLFHIATGYTLLGAFFLAPEDSSSPVNFIPMLIYGAGAGFLTVLIRNIGMFVDGVILGILIMNMINPLIDKIRPKAMGKVV